MPLQFSPETNIPRARTSRCGGRVQVHRTCFRLSDHSSLSLLVGSFSPPWRKPFRCKTRRVNPLAVPLCSATVACQVPFSLLAAARLVAGLPFSLGPFSRNNAAHLTERISSDVGVIFQEITFYALFRVIHFLILFH